MLSQVGVELVERTGRNPQNVFIQLGCSKMAEHKMLHYVRTQCIGKPFSNYAMVRSLVWPRETDHTSFFCAGAPARDHDHTNPNQNPETRAPCLTTGVPCAELVASVLKVGGLLDTNCNPGSATPEMLHRIYASRGAASANPCILRELKGHSGGTNGNAMGMSSFIGNLTQSERVAERESLMASPSAHGTPVARHVPIPINAATLQPHFHAARRRADSPPRGHFHAVNREYAQLGAIRGGGGACSSRCVTTDGVQLTMDSLKFGGTKPRPR